MKFRTFAATAPGSKYLAKGWNCQDDSGTLNFDGIQAAAVADGHGSSNCFRSDIGAQIAIKTAFQQIKIFCENRTDTFSDTGINNFKYKLVSEWRNAVRRDWNLHSENLGAGEIRYSAVSEKYKARYTSQDSRVVEKYLYTAYGTTLICALSIGTQILIFQIGDGTCVVLQQDGRFSTPVPADSENFLNVTTSLCDDKANLKIRHVVLDTAPAAIFLSTDGLDDCYSYYQNEEFLYKFYADVVIDNMINYGYHDTEKEIVESLLPGMTARGSRDDISLAYLIVEDIEILKAAFNKILPDYRPSSSKKVSAPDLPETLASSEKTSTPEISLQKITPVPSRGLPNYTFLPPVQKNIFHAGQITISTTPQVIPAGEEKSK